MSRKIGREIDDKVKSRSSKSCPWADDQVRGAMPRLRKLAFNRTVIFVTTSLEEGILLLPNALFTAIFYGCLARAQALYPVRICAFLFEGSHIHLILAVNNPDDVKDFMCRFKTESAHAINRLRGKRKRTVWCEGYDSPILYTVEDVIRELVYVYTNPVKDNLVESVDNYPGMSSWRMFLTGQHSRRCLWIRRRLIPRLRKECPSPSEYQKLARELSKQTSICHKFCIEPNAWMECFGIDTLEQRQKLNQMIIRAVREVELNCEIRRKHQGRSVIGRERLLGEPMDNDYIPERSGKKMWCICAEKELRKEFILRIKTIVAKAKEVYARWQRGDFSVEFPAGLYPPSMPKQLNVLRVAVMGR